MAGTAWFYVRDEKRTGPVSLQQMRELLSRGQVPPQTLVWTVGMNQWTPAEQVEALSGRKPQAAPQQAAAVAPAPFRSAPASSPSQPDRSRAPVVTPEPAASTSPSTEVAPEAQPQPHPQPQPPGDAVAAVAYYGYTAGIPPRAVENLKGHAQPTGDRGDWPLDDTRVEQFWQTMRLRKKVTNAAQLYRLLLFLSAIFLGVAVLVGAYSLLGGVNRLNQADIIAFASLFAFSAAFVALYYFAWRATMRAHRWAPLTMFIIYLLFAAFYVAVMLLNSATGSSAMYTNSSMIIGAFLFAVFAAISWQSFAAIPKYLAQPAWCQELIARSGL